MDLCCQMAFRLLESSLGLTYLMIPYPALRFPRLLDLLQLQLDDRGHLWRMPIGLLRFFRPGKGKVKDRARAFGLNKYGEGLQENGPLSLPIMYVSYGAAIRVLDGRNPGDTDLFMKLWSHRQDNG